MKVFWIILFWSTQLFAECSKIDLNHDTVLKDIPIYDQGLTQMCYAYTASQLLEFELRSKGEDVSTSPIGMSLVDATKGQVTWERSDMDGGLISSVIDSASANGMMDPQCVTDRINSITKSEKIPHQDFVYLLHRIYEEAKDGENKNLAIYNLLEEASISNHIGNCTWIINDLAKTKDWGQNAVAILKKLLIPCKLKPISKKVGKLVSKSSGTDESMLQEIDRFLEKKKPVGISICIEGLKSEPHIGVSTAATVQRPSVLLNLLTECHGHAVMAIGRREVNGQCEYLIRNSIGEWKSPFLKCACKTASAHYDDCSELKDDKVPRNYLGCWVSAKNIGANTMITSGFE